MWGDGICCALGHFGCFYDWQIGNICGDLIELGNASITCIVSKLLGLPRNYYLMHVYVHT